MGYGLSFSPWHWGCWHWHVSSVTAFASAQTSLQYFFPSAGIQLQAGRAHFDGAFMRSTPLCRAFLLHFRHRFSMTRGAGNNPFCFAHSVPDD